MGGLDQAIAKAAELAQIEDYSVEIYPREVSAFERIIKRFGGVTTKWIQSWIPDLIKKTFFKKNHRLSDHIFTRMPYDIEIR